MPTSVPVLAAHAPPAVERGESSLATPCFPMLVTPHHLFHAMPCHAMLCCTPISTMQACCKAGWSVGWSVCRTEVLPGVKRWESGKDQIQECIKQAGWECVVGVRDGDLRGSHDFLLALAKPSPAQ